jgi:hypothetical protein
VNRFRDYFNYVLTCAPGKLKENMRRLTLHYSRRGSLSDQHDEIFVMR